MVTVQSVQGHSGRLIHHFKFLLHLGTPAHSRLSARVPECQKIKNGGLDQYGAECFGRLIFCHSQKKCGTERVKL